MSETRPLWAPWRIDYIKSKKETGCFFCHKAAIKDEDGMHENHIVGHGDKCFIILNNYPYSSGHLMVCPYRHVGDLAELSIEERSELMEMCVRAQQILVDVMEPQGFNVGFNVGSASGAGHAAHLHMHVVPRWYADSNFMPVIGNIRVISEALDATAKVLIKAYRERYES